MIHSSQPNMVSLSKSKIQSHLSIGHVEKSAKVSEGLTDGELHEQTEMGLTVITLTTNSKRQLLIVIIITLQPGGLRHESNEVAWKTSG